MIPADRSSTRAKRLLLTLLLYKAIASEDGSILSRKKCAGLDLISWDFQKR